MKQRLSILIRKATIVSAVGLVYIFWCRLTHLAIPCLFHKITGFYCPGCGVSRMFIELSRLNFSGAFYNNRLLIGLLPILSVFLIGSGIRYVKEGKTEQGRFEKSVFIVMLIFLLAFGVLRNVPGFEMLQPGGAI